MGSWFPNQGSNLRCRVSTTGPHCAPSSGWITWCRHSVTLELGTGTREQTQHFLSVAICQVNHSPLTEPGRRGGGPHQGVMRTPSPKFQLSTAGEQHGHCGSAFLLDEEHLGHQNEVPSAAVTKHHRLVGVREEFPPSLTSGGLESEARCGQSLTPSKGSRKGRFHASCSFRGSGQALLGSWPHRYNPSLCHHTAFSSSKDASHRV